MKRVHSYLSAQKKNHNGLADAINAMPAGSVILRLEQITKRFPGVVANDRIDLEIRKGEIHALLGENGAGKTTLMNIAYGLYKPDSGNIYVCDEKVEFRSPMDAIKHGIGMVHQHFTLVPTLSVVENVILGLNSRFGLSDLKRAEDRVIEISKTYGLRADPKARIWQLSVGEQQRVEIIKAIYRDAWILILDEPTSVLTPQETDELFAFLGSIVRKGSTVIFITHKLSEVMNISHRVTVLRNGRVVNTIETSKTNVEELAKMMVGRPVLFRIQRPQALKGKVILKVQDLYALNNKGQIALKAVSFEVHEGEILGVAGVAGNGQSELAEVIYGMRNASHGNVYVEGRDMTNLPISEVISRGVGHVPEDRVNMGLVMNFNVAENTVLQIHSSTPFSKRGFINTHEVEQHAERLVSEFDVRTPSVRIPTKHLSGGNLQRLILAREFSRDPRLLLAVQPTRGLDVGATEYVRRRLLSLKERGSAILLISEDLHEIITLSDRIAVMYGGEILGMIFPEQADEAQLGLMMAGVKKMT